METMKRLERGTGCSGGRTTLGWGQRSTNSLPGQRRAACTCITEPRRCSSSSAAAHCSGSQRLFAVLHTFSNPTDEPVGLLAISGGSFPDVVAYPEGGYAWVA